MQLSKRGEYGIRAMIYLATLDGSGQATSTRVIAEKESIPEKFLEQILVTLKNAGLLGSRRGAGGGYYLRRPAGKITLGEIERVLDGPLAPVRCVSRMAYERCDCPDEDACGLRLVMGDVRQAIVQVLDHTTLADVTRRLGES
jgi:Rrf2 family protein